MRTGTRAKERIAIKLDCALVLGDSRKICMVQNISRNGVLTSWKGEEFVEVPFRIGDRRALEITFSDHAFFGSKHLRCEGKVVRVELEQKLVAFEISKPRFCSRESGSSVFLAACTGRVM